MKADKIRELGDEELEDKLQGLSEEIFRGRAAEHTGYV